jgi:hypothetical protein
MATGRSQAWVTGAAIGEVVFAPRQGASGELDGYYLTLARGLPDDRSWLYLGRRRLPVCPGGEGRDRGRRAERPARQLVPAPPGLIGPGIPRPARLLAPL